MSNDIFPDYEDIPSYSAGTYEHDPHGVVSLQLNELVSLGWLKWYDTSDDGTVIPNDEWKWDYYDIWQYKRVCDKINARYWFDEISFQQPIKWKINIIRKLNEIMPKYKLLYKLLDAGIDPLQTYGKYGKSRSIYSEFPETLLNGNSDYVSNGTDREYEDIESGDWLDKAMSIARDYNDVDVMILDELESMFSSLYTVSVNGF